MANECIISFYFRREELEKLLSAHPKAKGVVVSQEIKREKPRGSLNFVNITHIKARIDYGKKTATKSTKKLMGGGDDGGDGTVDGCPYPPGCTP
jgi:hypothetical protein